MVFNSIDFAVFLPIVFVLYWFVTNKSLQLQNMLIVVASYVFYGWWDWRFLSLIVFSTFVDYSIGWALKKEERILYRKLFLWTSILVNLGFLGFFKYYNFFVDNFIAAFSFFGSEISPSSLNVILPVGISFYTFQTLSYTIDVYKKKLEPTSDFWVFAAYVSFFPQLVAGPIERATNLLPQFLQKRTFNYCEAVSGMKQILWGLFKKIVIANNASEFANIAFDHSSIYPGSVLFIGAVFFAFQIYGDFSGYSDIAIGTSRLFGFNLMQNFAFPYFSRDIAEFWRRWHISLSTWFRDYLYIPLGGSRGSLWMKVRNTFIIFIVSGFWHGANWTFIIWGALNALYFMPLLFAKKNRNNLDVIAKGRIIPSAGELIRVLVTFGLTVLAWVFFRAENLPHAMEYLSEIFSSSIFVVPRGVYFYGTSYSFVTISILLFFFLFAEWLGRDQLFAIATLGNQWKGFMRYMLYYALILAIFLFGGTDQEFIYFQF